MEKSITLEITERVAELAKLVAQSAELLDRNTKTVIRCIDLIEKLNLENASLHERMSNLEQYIKIAVTDQQRNVM